MRIIILNLLTLAGFLLMVYWSLTDPREKSERTKFYLKPRSLLLLLFEALYFILNYLSSKYFPLPESGNDNLFLIAGAIIFMLGIIISLWAKITMGKFWGVPGEHSKSRQHKLIKTGPFQYSRNPIYLGLLLVLAGYGIAAQSYFVFLTLIPLYYFNRAVIKEEKLLEETFKKEYEEYKKEVPRFF